MTSKDSIGSSPLAHARWLHGSGKGYVTVGQKPDRKPWVQKSYPVEKLYEELLAYGGLNNVYISQNRFRGSRRTDRTAELSAMYSDVDYYEISDLADEILPLAEEQWKQQKAQLLAQKAEQEAARGARTAPEDKKDGRKGFGSRELHQARLDDLERLLELREMDKLPPGKRDLWMYVAGCSMSFLMDPQSLEKELIALGQKRAGWSEAETRSRMHSIISRANSAAGGETVPWNGQRRDTRYWLTNEKIIQILETTPEEEQHLKTIVSGERKKEISRQRDRERKKEKRRSEGVIPRDEYLAQRSESRQGNRLRAKELKAQGMSSRKIGRELGISHTLVSSLLKGSGE